ncbi:MAG: efflux RND transporter permease subunit [Rhodocyclaceae bacterium]|nr:efflux RND transporter permease subunit [Rhodocyclaceae bacterium]
MLVRLIQFSLTQRLLVLLLAAMLAAAGVYALRGLPIDAFPDVSTTQVKLIVKAPGMTPEEVETRIAVPLEQELLGIPRQRLLRSTSKYALTDITIDFEDGTDIYWARQQVAERYAAAAGNLPPGAAGGLAPITTPLGEMFMFTLEGDFPLAEKRALLDWVIRPQLRTVPGVADVNSLGGAVEVFEVVPSPQALAARGLRLAELQTVLEANNRNDGAGRLAGGEESLLVRAEGAVRTLDDLRAIVVRAGRAGVVRVSDVAEVRRGSLTRYGAVTRSGRGEAVQGLVLGLRGANAQEVVAGVKVKLAEVAAALPAGLTVEPFYDRSALVERAVQTVSKALLEAVVLVLLLLLAFLGNLRAALVVALTLPLSALATFILMRLFGLSANLMSLGGLAIAIGMLVDAAVVVVENVETQLAGGAPRLPLLHLIYRAAGEVAAPVASGILIIVIVFLPLVTLQGLEGKMFAPVALTIVFALSASLLLSLTVVPVLASFLLKRGGHHTPWLVRKLDAAYARVLAPALASGRKLALVALLLLAGAAAAYALLGKTFMPAMDEGDLIMQLEKLPSIGLEDSIDMDGRVQRAVLEKVPEIRAIVARTGSDELGLDPMGLNQTDTFLVLKPRAEWRKPDPDWLSDQLRAVMVDFPGMGVSFTQPIDMRVSEMLTGVRGDLAIKIYGPDLATLNRLAGEIETAVKAVAGAEDSFTVRNEGVQYLRVVIDRLAAGRYGLNVDDIERELKTLIEGQTAGVVVRGTRRIPVLLRGADALRKSPADFEQLRIGTPDGGSIALTLVARLLHEDGPIKVERENAERYAVVQSNVRGRDLVGFVNDAKAAVARAVQLPPGYRLVWSGQFENQQRAAARLAVVVPVALLLIFFLLFSTFRSVRQALLILSNVPFAMVGGVFGLLLAREYMSVPASVGFIALLGIAVLNGVVMVSHFNQLLAEGRSIGEAVVEGARRRLRPVLMTASIAAFGLVPMLFASGPGSEVQRPLAIVVVGGLLTSTALTLVLLPALFQRFGVAPARPFSEDLGHG